ncbi:dipeptidase [Pacificimonas sp. ICDLI1SI03]
MSSKTKISRRAFATGAAGVAVAFPMVNFGAFALNAETPREYSTRAVDLVTQSMVIDMLAPLNLSADSDFVIQPISDQMRSEFLNSGINAWHAATGVGGPDAYTDVLAYLARWQGFAGRNSDLFALIGTMDDLERAKADGRIGIIMGLQNSEHFRTPDDVKSFYELGQRCSQLTYNSQNRIGSGSTEREDGGISDFGVEIIKAMNDVGMLVDVSHSGDQTTLDATTLSSVPIAYTHSNCRAISGHPRAKTDEAITALGKNGGVMGITGVRNFVSNTEPTNVTHMVDHIDHVVKLIGMEHVGIGSDADLHGYDDMPPEKNARLRSYYKESYAFRDKIDTDGFDHPMKMFDLTEELIRRDYTDAHIQAILGGNFQRLLRNTWK